VASIAAIEAFRSMGWQTTVSNVNILLAEAKLIGEASAADDAVDDDDDGVADVQQISAHALAQRKVILALKTVSEPARVETALAGLWAAYIAVLATLKLEFARTTALALGIVENFEGPITRVLAPPLKTALGTIEIGHWTATVLSVGIKLVAIMLAWFLQVLISAFYTALRGGRIFANALCEVIVERGWSEYVEKLPGVPAPFDPETTHVDEAVGYALAAVGFVMQLLFGFNLPFPLNILLLPLEIVEWLLRWQITFSSPSHLEASG
jgi:hypothetical protein